MENEEKKEEILDIEIISTESSNLPSVIEENPKESSNRPIQQYINNDFEYARKNLKEIIELGRESLENLVDLANQSQHPRFFEVTSQLIKSLSETTKELIELHKSSKTVIEKEQKNDKEVYKVK